MTNTEAIEARIDAADRRLEEAKAGLYRTDGSLLYGEREHGERLSAAVAEHAAAFDAIGTDAGKAIEAAEGELLNLEHADPTDLLSDEELRRASAKSQLVLSECMNLPLRVLVKRMAAVLASGDRPAMLLYAQNAALRVGEPRAYDPNDPDAPRDEEGAPEIRGAAERLLAGLDPTKERRLARARQTVEDAQALRRQAYYRRHGASGAADMYARQKYAS